MYPNALGFEMPPVHPLLVNFTAALIPASVFSDWAGYLLRRESLRAAGWWMLLYAAVVTPLTAFVGWRWMRSMEDMDHWQMPIHMWLGFSVAGAAVLLAAWRGMLFRRNQAPKVAYLSVASAVVLALMAQGHLGAEMSFGPEAMPMNQPSTAPSAASQPATTRAKPGMDMPSTTQASDASQPRTLQWRDHLDLSGDQK